MNNHNLSESEESDIKDLESSKSINIKSVKSVCLMLGPYRNLTTLTASILFLHPNCQVLNHGASRIYGRKEIDFLSIYEKIKMDRFIQFAITISGKGKRGKSGGSITYSHAFDNKHKMKNIYKKTNLELVKKDIECLFWKFHGIILNHNLYIYYFPNDSFGTYQGLAIVLQLYSQIWIFYYLYLETLPMQ